MRRSASGSGYGWDSQHECPRFGGNGRERHGCDDGAGRPALKRRARREGWMVQP